MAFDLGVQSQAATRKVNGRRFDIVLGGKAQQGVRTTLGTVLVHVHMSSPPPNRWRNFYGPTKGCPLHMWALTTKGRINPSYGMDRASATKQPKPVSRPSKRQGRCISPPGVYGPARSSVSDRLAT